MSWTVGSIREKIKNTRENEYDKRIAFKIQDFKENNLTNKFDQTESYNETILKRQVNNADKYKEIDEKKEDKTNSRKHIAMLKKCKDTKIIYDRNFRINESNLLFFMPDLDFELQRKIFMMPTKSGISKTHILNGLEIAEIKKLGNFQNNLCYEIISDKIENQKLIICKISSQNIPEINKMYEKYHQMKFSAETCRYVIKINDFRWIRDSEENSISFEILIENNGEKFIVDEKNAPILNYEISILKRNLKHVSPWKNINDFENHFLKENQVKYIDFNISAKTEIDEENKKFLEKEITGETIDIFKNDLRKNISLEEFVKITQSDLEYTNYEKNSEKYYKKGQYPIALFNLKSRKSSEFNIRREFQIIKCYYKIGRFSKCILKLENKELKNEKKYYLYKFNKLKGKLSSVYGNFNQAIKFHQDVIDIINENKILTKKADMTNINIAENKINMGEYAEGLEIIKNVFDKNKENQRIIIKLAFSYMENLQYSNSEIFFNQAINNKFSHTKIRYILPKMQKGIAYAKIGLGILCFLRGKYKESIDFYQEAFDMLIYYYSPNIPIIRLIYTNLALSYDKLGQQKIAEEYLNLDIKYMENNNETDNIFYAISCNICGILNQHAKKYEESIEFHKKSLTIYKKQQNMIGESKTLIYIGNAYFYKGDLVNAENCYINSIDALKSLILPFGEKADKILIVKLIQAEFNIGVYYNEIQNYEKCESVCYNLLVLMKNMKSDIKEIISLISEITHKILKVLLNIGITYFKQNKLLKPKKLFENLLKIFDKQFQAEFSEIYNLLNIWLLKLYEKLHDFSGLRIVYSKLREICNQKTENLKPRILIMKILINPDFSSKNYVSAYKKICILEEICALNNNESFSSDILLKKSICLYKFGLFHEASDILRENIKKCKLQNSIYELQNCYFWLGCSYAKYGLFDFAMKYFDKAYDLIGNNMKCRILYEKLKLLLFFRKYSEFKKLFYESYEIIAKFSTISDTYKILKISVKYAQYLSFNFSEFMKFKHAISKLEIQTLLNAVIFIKFNNFFANFNNFYISEPNNYQEILKLLKTIRHDIKSSNFEFADKYFAQIQNLLSNYSESDDKSNREITHKIILKKNWLEIKYFTKLRRYKDAIEKLKNYKNTLKENLHFENPIFDKIRLKFAELYSFEINKESTGKSIRKLEKCEEIFKDNKWFLFKIYKKAARIYENLDIPSISNTYLARLQSVIKNS